MANNTATNVTYGKPKVSGSVYRASTSAALPTSAETELSSTVWTALGYISDDGVTNDGSISTEEVRAWGGDVVLDAQTEKTDKFTMTFIETLNPEVLKVIHGSDNVSGTLLTGITVNANGDEKEEYAYVIDMIMRGNVLKRIVIPDAKVTEIGEVSYTDAGPVGYEVTLTAYADDDGQTHYEYIIAAEDE